MLGIVLLPILMILYFHYRILKDQLKSKKAEIVELNHHLDQVRMEKNNLLKEISGDKEGFEAFLDTLRDLEYHEFTEYFKSKKPIPHRQAS